MAKKINDGKKDISILECNDYNRYDMQTSLYIYEIEDRTVCKKIKWAKEWDVKKLCYKYYATYVNKNGMKVSLELLNDNKEGIELYAKYINHGKLIKTLFLTEWTYGNELEDLAEAVAIHTKNNYVYDNNDRLTNPYYNRKYCDYKPKTYEKPVVTKVRNSRGLKADRLLENVEFSYNCQILGEKGIWTNF